MKNIPKIVFSKISILFFYFNNRFLLNLESFLPKVEQTEGFDGIQSLVQQLRGERAVSVLRKCGAVIGSKCVIAGELALHNAHGDFSALTVGSNCHIGRQVFLDLASKIELGDRVTLSMRSMILTHTDMGEARNRLSESVRGAQPVVLESDTYVGAGAILLPGVRVGRGAVIGAGAVVTSDVPAGGVVVGVPARSIAQSP